MRSRNTIFANSETNIKHTMPEIVKTFIQRAPTFAHDTDQV